MQVYLSDYFLRQIKGYLKKFSDLEHVIVETLKKFSPETATPLGHKLYKVRLRSTNIRKGKNKSFRMIIFLFEVKEIITPIAFYFKGDQENTSKKEIMYHLERVIQEVEKGS